ncbi:hypothetical protein CIE15_000249 [Salmonella enterica subsp. enterica serovar Oranienburg]|nr:hypothetical protein [Salmonella enterica subsp. enterica serovar Oranienburg]
MFNVKRNGASVEITDIPQSIPFSVFKDIADETGANECLVAYVKDKDCYEVVIRHDSVNMAAAVAWLVLEAREPENDIKEIKGLIGGTPENPRPYSVMHVYGDLIKISGGIPVDYLKKINDSLPKYLDENVFDGTTNGVFSVSEFGAGMKKAEWRFRSERAARETGDMITILTDPRKYELWARFIMPTLIESRWWDECGIPDGATKV